jgi:hypothetical protein
LDSVSCSSNSPSRLSLPRSWSPSSTPACACVGDSRKMEPLIKAVRFVQSHSQQKLEAEWTCGENQFPIDFPSDELSPEFLALFGTLVGGLEKVLTLKSEVARLKSLPLSRNVHSRYCRATAARGESFRFLEVQPQCRKASRPKCFSPIKRTRQLRVRENLVLTREMYWVQPVHEISRGISRSTRSINRER